MCSDHGAFPKKIVNVATGSGVPVRLAAAGMGLLHTLRGANRVLRVRYMKTFSFTAIAAVLFVAPALAQGTDREVMEAMARCGSITDTAQRVACYDAAAPRLRSRLATSPTATPAPVITRSRQDEASWFGFKMPDLFGGSTETQ